MDDPVDDPALVALFQQLLQQGLVPRALDAAADALRQRTTSPGLPVPLADLALYPHTLALDLSTPTAPTVVTILRVGVPDLGRTWFLDYIPLGDMRWRTTLAGQEQDATLTFWPEQERWLPDADDEPDPDPPPPPQYPVLAHGRTAMRAALYAPDPTTAVPAALIARLAAQLELATRAKEAHMAGREVIASCFAEEPADYGEWTPATMALRTGHVHVVFNLAYDYPVRVEVMLDVLGLPDPGSGTAPVPVGSYRYWTWADGTVADDSYMLWADPEVPAARPAPALPAELLRDLGHLTPRRQATLARLVAVVGEAGLRQLLRTARTRLAEEALMNPSPTRPKSVRGMLWHMLQGDALEPQSRAYVLGLMGAPAIPPHAESHDESADG